MAATRYFKATDGKRTFFRASPTRAYQSLTVYPDWRDWCLHRDGRGVFPATEITRQEYNALIALKNERGLRDQAKWEESNGRSWNGGAFLTAPGDSWVYNEVLA